MANVYGMNDDLSTRTYRSYYADLSQYPPLKVQEERDLLHRYHRCPDCNTLFPRKMKRMCCPACGELISSKVTSRLHTCGYCNETFSVYETPMFCRRCGSARDQSARDRLISANLRFVVKTGKSFNPNSDQLMQLISAGNLGLLVAVDKFDIRRPTRFLTYASWWIRKEMIDEINSNMLVHLPSHLVKERRKALKQGMYVCTYCGQRIDGHMPEPHIDGMDPCTHKDGHMFVIMDSVCQNYVTISAETLVIPDTKEDLEKKQCDDQSSSMLTMLLHKIRLRPRDRFIVLRYYGMGEPERNTGSKTLPQLSEITGITPERVRQVKSRTLNRLKNELSARGVTSTGDILSD